MLFFMIIYSKHYWKVVGLVNPHILYGLFIYQSTIQITLLFHNNITNSTFYLILSTFHNACKCIFFCLLYYFNVNYLLSFKLYMTCSIFKWKMAKHCWWWWWCRNKQFYCLDSIKATFPLTTFSEPKIFFVEYSKFNTFSVLFIKM